MEGIKRVLIVGGPGTGKSTLADNMGKILELPVYHIDGIHHIENWKKRDSAERDKIILDIVSDDKWVFDGTYKSTLAQRIDRADIIIYLRYSRMARLKGILSRNIKMRGKERPEIPGCKERLNFNFFIQTYKWDKKTGKVLDDVLDKSKEKNIVVFKKRKELNKWYEDTFDKTIEIK